MKWDPSWFGSTGLGQDLPPSAGFGFVGRRWEEREEQKEDGPRLPLESKQTAGANGDLSISPSGRLQALKLANPG